MFSIRGRVAARTCLWDNDLRGLVIVRGRYVAAVARDPASGISRPFRCALSWRGTAPTHIIVTGGGAFSLWGHRISSRGARDPLIIAFALLALRLTLGAGSRFFFAAATPDTAAPRVARASLALREWLSALSPKRGSTTRQSCRPLKPQVRRPAHERVRHLLTRWITALERGPASPPETTKPRIVTTSAAFSRPL